MSPTGQSAPGAEDALADARRAGIHQLALPTPFLVGRVNCYLIEDDPLTLIDTGPNSGKSLDELELALERLGHSVEALGLIVVTHQHMDHVGLLEILARRSGAEVAALHLLTPYLAQFSRSAAEDDEFAQGLMRRHGMPPDVAMVLGSVGAAFRAFGSSGRVTRGLREGDRLTFRDRTLHVFHRPGHSPSDTIFWDEDSQLLLAGDHLLSHISSNPLVSRPLDALAADGTAKTEPGRAGQSGPSHRAGERPTALIQYVASMRLTRELPARLVLSGHGEPITDHVALIDERLRMHRRRGRKILRMLQAGPLTAYEVALEMWGNLALTQAYLTLSEALGHLDLLIADGAVRELEDAEVIRFEARAKSGLD